MRIDLITHCSEPPMEGDLSEAESARFHAERNQSEYYWHERVQELAGINADIVRGTPNGTYIADLGAGRPRRFNANRMQEKNLESIVVERDPAVLRRGGPFDHSVMADLRGIPACFSECRRSLTEALHTVESQTSLPASREQYRLLYALVRARPLGTCILSHIAEYLPPEAMGRLSRLIASNLTHGGKIFLVTDAHHMKNMFGETSLSYHTLESVCQRMLDDCPQLSIESDLLLAPVIERVGLRNFDRHKSVDIDDAFWNLTDKMTGIMRLPGTQDDGVTFACEGSGKKVPVPGIGERVIVLRKNAVTVPHIC